MDESLKGLISIRTDTGEQDLSLGEFESSVRAGRILPTTPIRFPVLTGERWVEARELDLFWRLHEPAKVYFSRALSMNAFPTITVVFALLSIVAFLVSRSGSDGDGLLRWGAKHPAAVFEAGQTWRLLAANWLHKDPAHLVFNLVFLLNIGGTVENVYRRVDFALLVLVAALSTTLMSAVMSDAPSVGASGVVLGLFGAASILGHKYREILPARVKRYFLWAVLPYCLFVLYVGLATEDTDNWGHLGGLLGGSLAALALEPRLLAHTSARARWMLPAVLCFITLAAGPVIARTRPKLSLFSDAATGLVVPYPEDWTFGEDALGFPAFGNALGVTVGAHAIAEPKPIDPLARRSAALELLEGIGAVTSSTSQATPASHLMRAQTIRATVQGARGTLSIEVISMVRGFTAFEVSLVAPSIWRDAYEPLFERIRARIALDEPATLKRARAAALAFPGMSSAQVELGDALASVGDADGASRAYQLALASLPESKEALRGLARLSVDYGGDLDVAERTISELSRRQPFDTSLTLLLVDILEARARPTDAQRALEAAIERNPSAKDLRTRLQGLEIASESEGSTPTLTPEHFRTTVRPGGNP